MRVTNIRVVQGREQWEGRYGVKKKSEIRSPKKITCVRDNGTLPCYPLPWAENTFMRGQMDAHGRTTYREGEDDRSVSYLESRISKASLNGNHNGSGAAHKEWIWWTVVGLIWMVLCVNEVIAGCYSTRSQTVTDTASFGDSAPGSIFGSDVFNTIHTYYRPYGLLVLCTWFWALNTVAWQSARIDYVAMFGFNSVSHLRSSALFRACGILTLFWCTSAAVHARLAIMGFAKLAAMQPIMLYGGSLLALFAPVNVLWFPTRRFCWAVFSDLLMPWRQPVSFPAFYMADVLTSLAKVFSDMERAVCLFALSWTGTVGPWLEGVALPNLEEKDVNESCNIHSPIVGCILAWPFILRFVQCLRQYSDTRDINCVANAIKYSTALPVIALSMAKHHMSEDVWANTWVIWLCCSVVNTGFSFWWDVYKDWDLGNLPSMCLPVTLDAPVNKNIFLRNELMYGEDKRWVYYWTLVSNGVLRCTWTAELSPHLRHQRFKLLFVEALEIFRRFQWSVLRIEREALKRKK